MFKVTPNGPDLKLDQAAHRAIDHYLNPSAAPHSERYHFAIIVSNVRFCAEKQSLPNSR
ncbi:hypothetical protein [Pseudomonas sp. MPB23]|uniref:hypothetical protein n=1 Tax=Pseudomonas sp. MPB23 TaxID=3388490 RepID=UPI003984BF55